MQKKVFKILLSNKYQDYESACKILKADTLKDRRDKICINFSQKELKKDKSIFTKFTTKKNTRNASGKLVKEYQCRTDRYFRGGLPFLSRLLNISYKNTHFRVCCSLWWFSIEFSIQALLSHSLHCCWSCSCFLWRCFVNKSLVQILHHIHSKYLTWHYETIHLWAKHYP